MTLAPEAPLTAMEARSALAAEWASVSPRTPDEINQFYRQSEHLEADLEAFHTDPERQRWTEVLVHLATDVVRAKVVVDIGCGAGHDLRALRTALPVAQLHGVEPNHGLRWQVSQHAPCVADVADAPIEEADLLSCFDVLEHVPDPEGFLAGIAARAKVGAVLMETVATHDIGTPLHLPANRGWRPGHCMEAHGWERIGQEGRARIWQRITAAPSTHTALILCAYRSVSLPTVTSILKLLNDPENRLGWRVSLAGEAGINRARSVMASRWWAETADDVFLMLDDDIVFEPSDAEHLVELCRNGHDIICAAYPVRDAGHIALRGLGTTLDFAPGLPPQEIRHATTGFLAVHRRVLDAMIPTLPLCHGNQPWAFWPMFDFKVIEDEAAGGHNYLSEDYYFSEMAKELGFKVWLDPTVRLGHLAQVSLSVSNMAKVREALT